MSRYEIEVWSKNGVLLGDIRHLCSSLKWTMQRNAHETLEFEMDLYEYEQYIEKIGVIANPFSFMDILSTDIRVKREGKYLFGANIIKFGYSPDGASVKLTVSCTGYLNYLKDQYLTIDYDNAWQGDILWGVIEQVQAKTGSNFGIKKGNVAQGMKRDRHFTKKNVKDFIQQMTNVIKGPDIKFDADKTFHSYEALGNYRPDIRLVYPENVDSFTFERRGDVLFNYIQGFGSGNGDDAVQASSQDYHSMQQFYRREKVVTYNSVERLSTLQENVNGVLQATKDPRELPSFTVHDGILDLNDVGVGDTVYAELGGFKSLSHIKGYYRIEKIECSVDNNDAETVDITFDDINIDNIVAQQEEG